MTNQQSGEQESASATFQRPMTPRSQMARWYISDRARLHGPYSWQRLVGMALRSELDPNVLLIKDGSERWVRAGTLRALFDPNHPEAPAAAARWAGSERRVREWTPVRLPAPAPETDGFSYYTVDANPTAEPSADVPPASDADRSGASESIPMESVAGAPDMPSQQTTPEDLTNQSPVETKTIDTPPEDNAEKMPEVTDPFEGPVPSPFDFGESRVDSAPASAESAIAEAAPTPPEAAPEAMDPAAPRRTAAWIPEGVLALGAAVMLGAGIAFGFTVSNWFDGSKSTPDDATEQVEKADDPAANEPTAPLAEKTGKPEKTHRKKW